METQLYGKKVVKREEGIVIARRSLIWSTTHFEWKKFDIRIPEYTRIHLADVSRLVMTK